MRDSVCFAGELHEILSRDKHPSYSAEFYSSYITILLGVFYSVCRDLRELRHLVSSLDLPQSCPTLWISPTAPPSPSRFQGGAQLSKVLPAAVGRKRYVYETAAPVGLTAEPV